MMVQIKVKLFSVLKARTKFSTTVVMLEKMVELHDYLVDFTLSMNYRHNGLDLSNPSKERYNWRDNVLDSYTY